jgi:hypothetical protein
MSVDDVVLTSLGDYEAENVDIVHMDSNDKACYLQEGEGV